MWRQVLLLLLIFKRSLIAQMFSALSAVFFVRLAFRLLRVRLTFHSSAVHPVLESLNNNCNGNGSEYNGCARA